MSGVATKRGRPRIHATSADRVRAFRRRKKGCRLDIYVSPKASWNLFLLGKAWDCKVSQVIDRLLLEADDEYGREMAMEALKFRGHDTKILTR